jgi:AraC-like DNA-binding protein
MQTRKIRRHLDDQTVSQIRFELFNNGKSTEEVSTQFGVSYRSVMLVRNGQSHTSTFTRFINNQPVTVTVDPEGHKGQFENWLRTRAKRVKMAYADLFRLVSSSGGNCNICQSQLKLEPCAVVGRRKSETLCVDHDHATGAARGILCANCNSGLASSETERGKRRRMYLNRYSPLT